MVTDPTQPTLDLMSETNAQINSVNPTENKPASPGIEKLRASPIGKFVRSFS